MLCGILTFIHNENIRSFKEGYMADNNNRNNKNNKNSNRMRGIMTLVAWAVVLTVAMNYISAYSGNTANKSSSHEIK